MKTYAEMTGKRRTPSASLDLSENGSSEGDLLRLADRRPEALVQAKLISWIHDQSASSSRDGEKPANAVAGSPLQMKSDIVFGGRKKDCGTSVDAYIDAKDYPKGKSPPGSRPGWWGAFKGLSANIGSFSEKYLVQGHLLNHHVGGPDNMDNLTPITGSANTTMLNYFERSVKDSVNKGFDVHYNVSASYHYSGPPTSDEIAGSNLDAADKKTLDGSGYLNFFCDWIYADYTVYPHVGDRSKLAKTSPISASNGLWVKNESAEKKGPF